MSVEYINFNGKKYPIKLGIFSLQELAQAENIDLQELDKNISNYRHILFAALEMGARITKKPLTLKKEEMGAVLDECFIEFNIIFPKFFPEEEMAKMMEVGGKVVESKKKKPISHKSTGKGSRV